MPDQTHTCCLDKLTELSEEEYTKSLEELLPLRMAQAKACDPDEYDRILRVFLHQLSRVTNSNCEFYVDKVTPDLRGYLNNSRYISAVREREGLLITITGRYILEGRDHLGRPGHRIVTLMDGQQLAYGPFYKGTDAEYKGCYDPRVLLTPLIGSKG